MSDDEREPAYDHRPVFRKNGFDCPRCGLWVHQFWSRLQVNEFEEVETGQGTQRASMWWEARCQHCDLPSIWRDQQMIFPLAKVGATPSPDMPVAARELYEEAAAVAVVSRRAGAALARAMVERLVKELDPDAPARATLEQRIARIRPGVTTSLAKMLDVVRVTGNQALHAQDQPGELVVLVLDDAEGPQLVELLLETANDLVDELVTRPATVQGY